MTFFKILLFSCYALVLIWLSLAADPPQPQLSWPHKDKFGHALAYGLMTLLGAWAWSRGSFITMKGLLIGLTSAMFFGVLMEVLQGLLTPHRQAEWLDLAANLAGGLLVFAACLPWLKRRKGLKARASHPPDNPRRFP